MDPLIDEKFVLSIARVTPEFFKQTVQIDVTLEAYGPSKNEGFCYENAVAVDFFGEMEGRLVVGLDGYTKLKLFPYIARKYKIDPTIRSHSSSIIMEFANQILGEIVQEMKLGRFEIDIRSPENLDHKLVPVNLESCRQYAMIYFLKDNLKKEYLGRLYMILLLKKYLLQ